MRGCALVTGFQSCALPISRRRASLVRHAGRGLHSRRRAQHAGLSAPAGCRQPAPRVPGRLIVAPHATTLIELRAVGCQVAEDDSSSRRSTAAGKSPYVSAWQVALTEPGIANMKKNLQLHRETARATRKER